MRSTTIVVALLGTAISCRSNVKPTVAAPSAVAAPSGAATTRTVPDDSMLIRAILDGRSPALILEMIASADLNDAASARVLYYAADRPDYFPEKDNWRRGDERRPMFPVVKALVERGANVNAVRHDGSTPLHAACREGSADTVAYLISKGADVNAKDDGGCTPLHRATTRQDYAEVRQDLIGIIQCLVAHGAELNALDHHGYTPRDLARRSDERDLAHGSADALLKELGGKYQTYLKRAQAQEAAGKTP
jgi:ankyrin repeat protein